MFYLPTLRAVNLLWLCRNFTLTWPRLGLVPESLRWGHGGPLGESLRHSLPRVWKRATQRLWCSIMRLLASNRVRGEF